MSKKKPHKNQEVLAAEDRELFLNAFFQGEIAPVAKKKAEKKPVAKATVGEEKETLSKEDRELFLQAMKEGFTFTPLVHKQEQRPREIRAISKRRNLVDATIDLHGLSAENAVIALNRFIEKEQQRGSKTLLIVHGKGKGILRSAVLRAVFRNSLVDDFQKASEKLGGEGAIIVRINRKRL